MSLIGHLCMYNSCCTCYIFYMFEIQRNLLIVCQDVHFTLPLFPHHTLGVIICQSTSSPPVAYYHQSGYTGYPVSSNHLDGGETLLELRFKYCNMDGGLLLHATSTSGQQYFALGLDASQQLYIEFSTGSVVIQVNSVVCYYIL